MDGSTGSAMQRLSGAILNNMEGIDEIVISLDSHNVCIVVFSVVSLYNCVYYCDT
jgi:hypothetical protein